MYEDMVYFFVVLLPLVVEFFRRGLITEKARHTPSLPLEETDLAMDCRIC